MIRTYKPSQIADAILAGDFVRETEFVLASEVERLRAFEVAHKQLQAALDVAIRKRNEARDENVVLRRFIDRMTRERDEQRAAKKEPQP